MDCAMGTFLFLPILPGFSGSVMAIVSLLTFQSWLDVEAALAELTIIPAEMPDSSRLEQVRNRLPAGAKGIRTCMGLFLSSSRFWFVAGSLFGAGKPFFVPSPAVRFAERAEGVKGPKR